ncbi:MAG TPA: monovalent cation/H+ antiporter complex subunit F [Candidatus Baltobacteraceae bacterium]|nr:monovalent cation/H+ antiporter complex subunit F [Candidatus Baltobacteraceae bacterium]
MNVWYAASIAMLLCLIPCVVVAVRGRAIDALIALEVATALGVIALLLLEQGMQRQTFFDVSLALAVLAFPSTLLFARFYRRWL